MWYCEYLDYKNCKRKKRLVDKVVGKCNKTIDKVKLTKITHTKNENSYKHNFCTVYIILISIFFITNVGTGANFIYYKYANRNKRNVSKYYDYFYSIFSSKVIILLNNRKSYPEIQRPVIFKCHWYGHQTFKVFDLNKDFLKLT